MHRWLSAVLVFLCVGAAGPGLAQEGALTADQEGGKKLYLQLCVWCHGEQGDGNGASAERLRPRPRDFTRGLFKIRSTPSGKLPTDEDLLHVIQTGMPGTAMPAWGERLNDKEILQLVQYIKTFSRRFARAAEPAKPIAIGTRVASSAESIAKGRQLFRDLECFKCHGDEGRADGPSASELTDDWGNPIRPANLTKPWNFRGGHRPEDLYLRLHSGLAGSPMPSFADSLDNEKTWNIINFVMSIWPDNSGNFPPIKEVIRVRRTEGEIPSAPDDPFWKDRQEWFFPMVGQVIREPRQFNPTVDAIKLKVVYNDREIGFWVSWDDYTASRPDPDAGVYEDAVALQFPVKIPTDAKRPYFLMGSPDQAVHLLRWDSASQKVTEINANGVDKLTPQSDNSQETHGAGRHQHGQYQVVIKRPLKTEGAQDTPFEPGRYIPISFFAWDGSNGENGAQMAISHWYSVLLEPPVPITVYIYPVVAVVATGVVQAWVFRRLQRRASVAEEPRRKR